MDLRYEIAVGKRNELRFTVPDSPERNGPDASRQDLWYFMPNALSRLHPLIRRITVILPEGLGLFVPERFQQIEFLSRHSLIQVSASDYSPGKHELFVAGKAPLDFTLPLPGRIVRLAPGCAPRHWRIDAPQKGG